MTNKTRSLALQGRMARRENVDIDAAPDGLDGAIWRNGWRAEDNAITSRARPARRLTPKGLSFLRAGGTIAADGHRISIEGSAYVLRSDNGRHLSLPIGTTANAELVRAWADFLGEPA